METVGSTVGSMETVGSTVGSMEETVEKNPSKKDED